MSKREEPGGRSSGHRNRLFRFLRERTDRESHADNTFYVQVKPDDAEEIVNEHVIKGRKVERLLYKDPEKKEAVSDSKHMGFYKKQLRIALRNCGFIDPEKFLEVKGDIFIYKFMKQPPQIVGIDIEVIHTQGICICIEKFARHRIPF